MCVPYLKKQRCGGFRISGPDGGAGSGVGGGECKKGRVCVEGVVENCPDCPGYCVWSDGRDALTKEGKD